MRAITTMSAVTAFALVAITATACSSASKSSTASGSATGSGSGSGGSSGGGSVADGLGHPITLCTLLPVATVAQLSGENLTVTKEQDTPSYKIYMCDYTSADGTSGVTVSVLAMDAAAGYNGALSAFGSSAKQISGVGDKAFSAITGVQALFGNVSITVSNLQSDDAAVQIIKALQPKL
ncbi:MAG TPA: hypothetical protein VGX23_11165 [Actinocrinis sp.]|nr:hypothetical protein [Actinocrinis sp.]